MTDSIKIFLGKYEVLNSCAKWIYYKYKNKGIHVSMMGGGVELK